MTIFNETLNAIHERRATRRFSQREVGEDLLNELIEAANHAPSNYNLQPWHFIIVRDSSLRRMLSYIALGQKQVLEAPVTVVFAANSEAWRTEYGRVLSRSVDTGAMTMANAQYYRKSVDLMFKTGPLGILGMAKRIAVPIRRLRKPTPDLLTTHGEVQRYLGAQTMLAAATFMIAAKSVGLDTCPLEGFDEYRLKKLLNLPHSMSVPIIIALGYRLDIEQSTPSWRFSANEKVHIDRFGGR